MTDKIVEAVGKKIARGVHLGHTENRIARDVLLFFLSAIDEPIEEMLKAGMVVDGLTMKHTNPGVVWQAMLRALSKSIESGKG
jgi:hypothetical protein